MEFKILSGTKEVVQMTLNQWKHQYEMQIGQMTVTETSKSDFPLFHILVQRYTREEVRNAQGVYPLNPELDITREEDPYP